MVSYIGINVCLSTKNISAKIFDKARSLERETDIDSLPEDEMIRILDTTQQVGKLTAVI